MMARGLMVLACAAGMCLGAAQAAPAPAAASPAPAATLAKPAPAPVDRAPAAADADATAAPAPPASAPAAAAAVAPAAPTALYVPPPVGSSAGNLLQTILALCFVLALLGALAWFLKRYGPRQAGGSAQLRLVGALSLGGRERIIVVEVGDQWIVVGASPGRVNALATLPRQESAPAQLSPHQPSAPNFAEWLKQTIDKRNAK
jgi:flagellar protein FliO/FliZ